MLTGRIPMISAALALAVAVLLPQQSEARHNRFNGGSLSAAQINCAQNNMTMRRAHRMTGECFDRGDRGMYRSLRRNNSAFLPAGFNNNGRGFGGWGGNGCNNNWRGNNNNWNGNWNNSWRNNSAWYGGHHDNGRHLGWYKHNNGWGNNWGNGWGNNCNRGNRSFANTLRRWF